jgi:hypothetical protein
MKTKYQRRRTFVLFSGFSLAMTLGYLPDLYADGRKADSPVVEAEEEKNIKTKEQPVEPGNTFGLIGPSGQEIHDFLYPTLRDGKVVTPAN